MTSQPPTIRRRHTERSLSAFNSGAVGSSSSSAYSTSPPPDEFVPLRARAYSYHHGTPARPPKPASSYGSSLLESLDLSGSMWSLRDYMLGKLEEAEGDIKALKACVEDSDPEDGGLSYEEEEDEEDEESPEEEWEVVTKRKGRSLQGGKVQLLASRTMDRDSLARRKKLDISAMEVFINRASGFIQDIRATLPALPATTCHSASLVQFQLSPDARLTLDRFLEDHPLPSFPQLDIRARLEGKAQVASDSANALLARVSEELKALQAVVSQLTNASSTPTTAKDGVMAESSKSYTSYMPSLPSVHPMSSPPLASVRDYFSAESVRLSRAVHALSNAPSRVTSNLRTLRDETSDQFQVRIAHLRDEATEFTHLLSSHSTAAFDEAARMYHAALELGRQRLLKYDELPHEWRNNEHILSGYRYIPIARWGILLRSAFEMHNETINIQSHFIGFLSLVYLSFFLLPYSSHTLPNSHSADMAIAVLFIGAAMKCLLCSAAWHLLSGCATGHWHRGAACVDYVGISALIAASVMGMEYYGFYCRPQNAMAYMAFSGALGIAGMVLPWQPWFNERRHKISRIAFFLGLAGSAVAPMLHMSWLYGLTETTVFFAPALPSIMAYLVGLSFYAKQFPECVSPGRWDNFFASHQLWHVAIVMAVWMHWRALNIWAGLASEGSTLSCLA